MFHSSERSLEVAVANRLPHFRLEGVVLFRGKPRRIAVTSLVFVPTGRDLLDGLLLCGHGLEPGQDFLLVLSDLIKEVRRHTRLVPPEVEDPVFDLKEKQSK
jgi:hypothetical protein